MSAFLDWLGERLAYGGVRISEPVPAELDETKLVRRVELVTAGYSDDEELLGRVHDGSMFAFIGHRPRNPRLQSRRSPQSNGP